ncbi:hypothetical protein QSI_2965 [Clostridioides difficile P28]|nr:hypothetical protein QSI_2965 [Clostridioides difficile P28]
MDEATRCVQCILCELFHWRCAVFCCERLQFVFSFCIMNARGDVK